MNQVSQLPDVSQAKIGEGEIVVATHRAATEVQARQLDACLLVFAREVLSHDDAASEMPLRQLRVCMELVEGARSMSALSRELGVSLSAMTQIANRLERAGLVTRSFEGSDRRVRRLRLTPRARRMLRLREEARIHRIATVLERMPAEAREDVLRILDSLRCAAASNEAMDDRQPHGVSSDAE